MTIQPMDKYEVSLTSSGTTNTIVAFSNEGENVLRKKFVRVDTIKVTRGFIDDAVEGTPIFEHNRNGKIVLDDREGALGHLSSANPHLTPLVAAELAVTLADPINDLTQYGFKQHYWHPLKE